MPQPPLSPEAEAIIGRLPAAVAGLQATETSLRENQTALGGIEKRRGELNGAYETAVAGLVQEHATLVLASYGSQLKQVIEAAVGEVDGQAVETLSLEDCERIARLDDRIRAAAGQPVMVMKPGKSWFDIGRLTQSAEPDRTPGLLPVYKPKTKQDVAQLPMDGCLILDRKTGMKPGTEVDDDELWARLVVTRRDAIPPRPAFDPLRTRLIDENERLQTDADNAPEVTLILVGYGHLRQELNAILGFDISQNSSDNSEKFLVGIQLQEQLARLDIDFDMDYLDGHLATRIRAWEEKIQGRQADEAQYETSVLNGLRVKQASLIESGWLKPGV